MLANGIDLAVVDNTNLHPWETETYTDAARAAGYRIVIMNFLPREFEKHMAAQKVTPGKPDAHEVPEPSMREHIAEKTNRPTNAPHGKHQPKRQIMYLRSRYFTSITHPNEKKSGAPIDYIKRYSYSRSALSSNAERYFSASANLSFKRSG